MNQAIAEPEAAEEMALVPQQGETEADFSQRIHDALAVDMGTDGAQRLAFQIWDETHGQSELQQMAAERFTPDQFVAVPFVSEFAEHTAKIGRKVKNAKTGKVEIVQQTTIYDRNAIQAIANRCNHRIADTGDFPPVTEGHTPAPEELANGAKQPKVLAYAGPFRPGLIGNKEPRWAIFATEWHHVEERPTLAKLLRRSPELWTEEKMEDRFMDPIAALGAEVPRLDMGLVRMGRKANGRLVEKYSAVFPGADTGFIPGEVPQKKKNTLRRVAA